MKNELELYYFSGTGNTKFIVDYVISKLNSNGVDAEVYHIEDKSPKITKGKNKMFVFPANSQSVSPFIWKFFKDLPEGNGEKLFVLITLNESSYVAEPLYKLFKKKGYTPVYFSEVSMPNNMIVNNTVDTENDKTRVKNALKKCDEIVQDIVNGKSKWVSEFKGSRFVSFLSRNTNLPWISMRLIFKLEVNKETCTKCGICEKSCPVGNIEMKDGPKHNKKCQFCMRCISSCPNKAIYFKGKEKFTVRNMKKGIDF